MDSLVVRHVKKMCIGNIFVSVVGGLQRILDRKQLFGLFEYSKTESRLEDQSYLLIFRLLWTLHQAGNL